jgi:hypothetical protein
MLSLACLAGCTKSEATDGGTETFDAFVPNNADCPGPLAESKQTCPPGCQTPNANNMREFGEATLDTLKGKSWLVVTWAVSEVAAASANAVVSYTKSSSGALTPSIAPISADARFTADMARARAILGDAAFDAVFGAAHTNRVRGEATVNAMQKKEPYTYPPSTGTAIRGRAAPHTRTQGQACSVDMPMCGATALCVIMEGMTSGTCETSLMLKFRTGATTFDMVTATVKKVGTYGGFVVDDAIAGMVQQSDIDELSKRFDEHIAPLDHMFFGDSKDAQGHDRDGNGVVMIFLTERVRQLAGNEVVGFFAKDDLLPTSMAPTSNAADILYMVPPGMQPAPNPMITLDQVSGTIAHEYQHMINYYAKKIINNSSQEDTWLDEGLATFAEDVQGYGSDSFKNIAAYLMMVDQISLTGYGLQASSDTAADSIGRRGMANLLVRYYFEQKGGATWGTGGADVTDKGGIAAVHALVQSKDTGTLLFTQETTGRKFGSWVADLMTAVAISNAAYPGVSCNPMYHFLPPAADAYTHYQRGIDLRRMFMTADGMMVTLMGPNTATLENDPSIPLPTNGGEVRTLALNAGQTKVVVGGSADYDIGFHAVLTDMNEAGPGD